jgi:hypothetical protein
MPTLLLAWCLSYTHKKTATNIYRVLTINIKNNCHVACVSCVHVVVKYHNVIETSLNVQYQNKIFCILLRRPDDYIFGFREFKPKKIIIVTIITFQLWINISTDNNNYRFENSIVCRQSSLNDDSSSILHLSDDTAFARDFLEHMTQI